MRLSIFDGGVRGGGLDGVGRMKAGTAMGERRDVGDPSKHG